MKGVEILLVNNSTNENPNYATVGSAGMDLRANLVDNDVGVFLIPNSRVLISTGIKIELPVGYEAQIRPRSGLAMKHGITVLNSPGTIDSDYRGDIGIILHNTSNKTFEIKHGDRIAQMVISEYIKADVTIVDGLSSSQRGDGGFGSTGTK